MSAKLTAHFTIAEFVHSQTAARRGIDNSLPDHLVGSALRTCTWLEALRAALGDRPLPISSGWRSPRLNRAVGGSSRSYHCLALAADLPPRPWAGAGDADALIRRIRELHDAAAIPPLDKAILEFGHWVHVQLPVEGRPPRGEFITAERGPLGRTRYAPLI